MGAASVKLDPSWFQVLAMVAAMVLTATVTVLEVKSTTILLANQIANLTSAVSKFDDRLRAVERQQARTDERLKGVGG